MPSFLDLVLRRLSPPPPPPMPLPLSPAWFAEQSAAREAAEPSRSFTIREYPSGPSPIENYFAVRQYPTSGSPPEIGPGENLLKMPMVVPPGISYD